MPFNLAGFVFCVCLWYVLLSAEDMTRIPGTNNVLGSWRTPGNNLLSSCGYHVSRPTRLGKMSKPLLSSRLRFWKPCSGNSGDCHVWQLATDASPHSDDGRIPRGGYIAWRILRRGTLESTAGRSFDPSAEEAITTSRPPLSRIICPCRSLMSTDHCYRPCCHTLRRCSLTARTRCLRREEWDHDPPAVTTRSAYWRLTAVDFINRVSIRRMEMSFAQDQQEHLENLDASSADKDSSRSADVLESKGGSMEPLSSTFDPPTLILSIRHRLTSIVNRELEQIVCGESEVLSVKDNNMLQLASLSVLSSATPTLFESDPSNLVSTQPVPTYAGVLSAPKAVTFTPDDVRSFE